MKNIRKGENKDLTQKADSTVFSTNNTTLNINGLNIAPTGNCSERTTKSEGGSPWYQDVEKTAATGHGVLSMTEQELVEQSTPP